MALANSSVFSNTFNTALIKSKIDTLENYAKKNQLHKLRMDDLFDVLKLSKTEEDYRLSLHLLNLYYNFGRNLNTQQDVNLFFIFILRTKQLNEAKELHKKCVHTCTKKEAAFLLIVCMSKSSSPSKLLKHFNGWLLCPPSNKYILLCMEEFFKKKKFYDVREVFSFIRQNSQIKLESSFYTVTIKAMLMLEENSVQEAMIIYDDSYGMSIYLTNEIHNLLLENILYLYHTVKGAKPENEKLLKLCEGNVEKIIIRLINELIKNRTSIKLSSKSLSLLAWAHMHFDVNAIIKKTNHDLVDVQACNTWLDIFKLSCLYNQIPECRCSPFSQEFKTALCSMKDDEDAARALEYIDIYFHEE